MYRALILLPLILLVTHVTQASAPNAGFVQGFWFSSPEPFAGETVRIYVALRNNAGGDLTGTVSFYVDDKAIGSQQVSALDNRIIESWTDWKPTYGAHTIRAELRRGSLSTANGADPTNITLGAAEETLFIDYDTDADGIGNQDDIDDDGDGISDETEVKNGTDPLIYDEPVAEETESAADTTSLSETTTAPAGLEQYLTPSRVDTMLGNITAWASSTKAQVDSYRETRAAAEAGTDTTDTVEVNNDGFGEITRSTDPVAPTVKPAELPNGFVGDSIRLVGKVISGIISLILALASWLLGNPILIQLLLLLGILFALTITARTLSRRPLKS